LIELRFVWNARDVPPAQISEARTDYWRREVGAQQTDAYTLLLVSPA
jgi:hypothetical protein